MVAVYRGRCKSGWDIYLDQNYDGGQALIPRIRTLLLIIPVAIILVAGCTASGPAVPDRGSEAVIGTTLNAAQVETAVRDLSNRNRIVPGELSLRLVDGEKIDPVAKEWNLSLIDYKEFIDCYHFAIAQGDDLGKVISGLREDARIVYAEPVYRTKACALRVDPNDTEFVNGKQWYLENMDVPEAWVIEPGDPAVEPAPLASDVAVAILDTGIDYHHDDLMPDPADVENLYENYKIFPGYDFVNGDADPQDDNGHGTMVAGIIGARTDNDFGIASVSWNARLIPIKILDSVGNGTNLGTADGIWHAVSTFMDQKGKVDPFDQEGYVFANPFNARLIINMSYAWEGSALGPSNAELNAVEYAIDHGALLVAAAGDGARPLDNGVNKIYPASYPGVIAVGATDQANALSPDSNTLPLTANPETAPFFVAPGVDIVSTYPMSLSDGYGVGSGTSFSAACLSGVVALIWSQYPFLSPSQVIQTLVDGADSNIIGELGADYVSGHGLINALHSLDQNFSPNPTDDPMIVRAFTNPILHGDVVFIVRSHYDLLNATDTPPAEDPEDPFSPPINDGMPFRYIIGWDYDLDGAVDFEFPYVYLLDTYYWRHEINIGEVDSATYIGRVHFPQDLTLALTDEPHPMGQLVIEFIGVPADRKVDTSLPETVSASTAITIDEFNYDLPG